MIERIKIHDQDAERDDLAAESILASEEKSELAVVVYNGGSGEKHLSAYALALRNQIAADHKARKETPPKRLRTGLSPEQRAQVDSEELKARHEAVKKYAPEGATLLAGPADIYDPKYAMSPELQAIFYGEKALDLTITGVPLLQYLRWKHNPELVKNDVVRFYGAANAKWFRDVLLIRQGTYPSIEAIEAIESRKVPAELKQLEAARVEVTKEFMAFAAAHQRFLMPEIFPILGGDEHKVVNATDHPETFALLNANQDNPIFAAQIKENTFQRRNQATKLLNEFPFYQPEILAILRANGLEGTDAELFEKLKAGEGIIGNETILRALLKMSREGAAVAEGVFKELDKARKAVKASDPALVDAAVDQALVASGKYPDIAAIEHIVSRKKETSEAIRKVNIYYTTTCWAGAAPIMDPIPAVIEQLEKEGRTLADSRLLNAVVRVVFTGKFDRFGFPEYRLAQADDVHTIEYVSVGLALERDLGRRPSGAEIDREQHLIGREMDAYLARGFKHMLVCENALQLPEASDVDMQDTPASQVPLAQDSAAAVSAFGAFPAPVAVPAQAPAVVKKEEEVVSFSSV